MPYLKRNFSSTSVERTLQANLLAGSTTLTLDSDVGIVAIAFPYTLIVDPDVAGLEEIITVLSRGAGYTFTVVRGSDGTVSVDHATGSKVRHMLTARDLQEPQNHLDATTAYTILNPNTDAAVTTANITVPLHGIASGEGAVVGTLKTQTLTNKTLTSPILTGVIPIYNAQTGTTYTFVLADVGKTVTANNASPQTYTIPPQASVTWLANTTLHVLNLGVGVVTFAAGAGVTVTNAIQTLTQYQSARLVRTASDAWTVTPDSGGAGGGTAIAYQANAPSSPATGDIWIESDVDIPAIDSTLYYRWTKTMSGGETTLSGTDNNSLSLVYTIGYESVFINGVLQVRGLDYVASTGTTVTGLIALTANDVVTVESIVAYSVGDTYTQATLNTMFSPITTTGLVLVSSTTIGTTVSSVTVTGAFSATFDNYKIVVSGGVASADVGGNVTLGATTTGYFVGARGLSFSGVGSDSNTNAGSSFAGIISANTSVISGNFELQNPFTAKKTVLSFAFTNATSGAQSRAGGGFLDNTTSYTAFTITPSSGTYTGGTIKVYGYK